MLTDELKPCPFCGGPVTLERTHRSIDEAYGERQWFGVKCRNTLNRGGTCAIEQVPSASREAAIARWNRRAIEAEVRAEAQEPVAWACWGSHEHVEIQGSDALTGLLGRKAVDPVRVALYAAQQSPAPGQKCVDPEQIIALQHAADTAEAVARENVVLQAKVAEQAALIEKCEKGLASVEWLIGDSQGVIGLHLNGDSAPWTSLRIGGQFETWLVEFDEALAAIAAQKGGAV